MRPWPNILLLGVSLAFLGTISSSASAKTAGYCLECHSQKFVQKFSQHFERSFAAEDRSVYQAKLDPCPGIRSLSEEMFFIESRIVKLDQILLNMGLEGWATASLRKKVSETAESFLDLKGDEKRSIAQFSQESSIHRAALQKVYDRTLQARNESGHRWLIGLGSLILLGISVLLGVGYRKLNRMGQTLLLFLLIGGTLSLAACSYAPEPEKKSPAQERLEQSLSVATQASSKTEEAFYQSFLLAEMASEWSKIESGPAEKAFQLAWKMALTVREKADEIRSLKEVVSRWPDQGEASKQKVNFDAVLDLRDEIRNAEGRTWALRAIAEEWIEVNKKEGRKVLETASEETLNIKDIEIRDRDLKSIAQAWAGIDENRALEVSRSIINPFLKSQALTDAALSTRDRERTRNLLQEAWKAAESIPLSYSQSKAFIQISAAAARIYPQEKKAWAERTFAQIQNLKNSQLQAFAIQEMVFHWAPLDVEQAERIVIGISPLFPEVRAYSFIYLSRNTGIRKVKAVFFLRNALAEISKVNDPFEAQKIKSLIAKSWVRLELGEALRILPQIEDPFYRSEILGQLAIQFSQKDKRKGLILAEKIPLEAIRNKVIVGIISQWMDQERDKVTSLYREAFQAALSISDPYTRALTLIELGKNWGGFIRGKETPVFDMALKSAEGITSLPMKTEILETLAEAWKNSDKTMAQKVLERIDPSVIRVRKSMEEIRLWTKTNPMKALQWAEAFPTTTPLEKAMALKEVAASMKKSQPVLAFDIFEKALMQVLTLSERSKGRKLFSQLIIEAALLDKERTFHRLCQIPDRETRDLFLSEAGNTWIKEDASWAMKAASEISESSFRFVLYQKIADGVAKNLSISKLDRPTQPELLALSQWGVGRGKAKKDESQAIPFYEKALQEIEKVKDPRERSYLLSGLAADWAPIDEEKALRVAEKISSDFPEPFSCALLQIGTQLRKWNRKGAESVFQKTFSAAVQIQDPSLRVQRLLQLAHEWQMINRVKGKEILVQAKRDIRKNFTFPGPGEKILTEILITQTRWEPEQGLTIAQIVGLPTLRAKILIESGKLLSKATIEENIKALEKALQFAQRAKNPRLMSEIAMAWFALEPDKGLELIAQVGSKEIRVKALRQMAQQSISSRREEAKRLLEKATQEALGMDEFKEKVKALKGIAGDWAGIDKEKAKVVYRLAYQLFEKASWINSKF